MKTLLLIALLFNSTCFADQVYECASKDKTNTGFHDGALRVNFSRNLIWFKYLTDDPSIPANWKSVFSSEYFCGYKPSSDSTQIKCPFAIQDDPSSKWIGRDLLCEKQYSDGGTDLITNGQLWLQSDHGGFQCWVHGQIAFSLDLSGCKNTN